MSEDRFSRTRLLYGKAALEKLAASRVAVFGVGGVGGYVVEALARSGVGALDLIDHDTVSLSNINRQILATDSTVGRLKVEVAAERIRDINPDCQVRTFPVFFLPETRDQFCFSDYDYVVDAIDTVTGKLAIIEYAKEAGVPVISAMGAGNKRNPAAFEVADLYQTSVCPLAKVMRRECRKRGIKALKVVYSREEPLRPLPDEVMNETREEFPDVNMPDTQKTPAEEGGFGMKRRSLPGSVAFAPSVAGLIMAGEIVNDLTRDLWPQSSNLAAQQTDPCHNGGDSV